MQIAICEAMATYIAARIAGFSAEADDRHRWQAEYVAKFGALPLYLGWSETIGIRPDGEVVTWSTESAFAGVRSVEERPWVLMALVAGAEQYPELRPLLPVRAPGAVDCCCRNHPLFASGRLQCGDCGGIGWIPAPTAESPSNR